MFTAPLTLAQLPASSGTPDPLRVVYAVGIVILLVVALGLVALQLRKRLLADDSPDSSGSMFDELRGMLKRGQITQAEYDSMRRRLVERVSASSLSGSDPAATPPIKTPRPAASGDRVAPPGFDLTGRPLPRPAQAPPSKSSAPRPPKPGEPGSSAHESDKR